VYLCIRPGFWTGPALLSFNETKIIIIIIIIIIIYCRQLTLFHRIERADSVIMFIIIIIIVIQELLTSYACSGCVKYGRPMFDPWQVKSFFFSSSHSDEFWYPPTFRAVNI